ncbi:DNA cytosine methyltransferase [Kitasatospora sp. GAS1066B]|uniref:DNA cytosine methyltransferase n=2 Tax=unclassified Kitasatospora TaxID=2633591 RepID=UPI00351640C6
MRIGSLCSGYGGLDQGVQAAFGGSVAWHAESNPHAAAILRNRWPHVPNLGDITQVDWRAVEPVCVLAAGFPCQDVSVAGARRGLMEGTRSGLWHTIARAIQILNPCLVVIENVRGILSAPAAAAADGDLEFCPWCLGDTGAEPAVRALGVVLSDLAGLGMDARWTMLRASDVGAPHRRERIFLTAWPRSAHAEGEGRQGAGLGSRGPGACRHAAENSDVEFGQHRGQSAPGSQAGRRARSESQRRGGASAADAEGERRDARRPELAWQQGRPDAAERDGAAAAGIATRQQGDGDADHGVGLLTPVADLDDVGARERLSRWGPYGPAITRWERVTRPAPDPTDARGRLAPAFVEWIMGVEKGLVCDVPGLSRAAQLTALGNGVVPQQAARALELLSPPAVLCGAHRHREA